MLILVWDLTFHEMNSSYLDKRGWGKRERKRQKRRRRRERDNFLLLVKEQTSVSPVFVSCLCQNCSPPWIHFLQYFASRKKNDWKKLLAYSTLYPYGPFTYNSLKWLMCVFWKIQYYSFVLHCVSVIHFLSISFEWKLKSPDYFDSCIKIVLCGRECFCPHGIIAH